MQSQTKITRKFSIQIHHRKNTKNKHWDLRIENLKRNKAWSFAIPKSRFPKNKKDFLLFIKTEDHPISYMNFEGKLNNGDMVELFDYGKVDLILSENKSSLILIFNGKKIKGVFFMVHIKNDKNSFLVFKKS